MLPELELHSHEPLSPIVESDLTLAHDHIQGKEKFSIVAAKNGRIVADVTEESPSKAYEAAVQAIDDFYRERHWIRAWQDIVAVINFDPTDMFTLGRAGIDVVLALERPPSFVKRGKWTDPGPQDHMVKMWLDAAYPRRDGTTLHNKLRAVAFLAYRHKPVLP